jgi:hypothetical protein
MSQTHQHIKRLIEIRDKAVEFKDESITEQELKDLSTEAISLAERSEILDHSKYDVLKQLMDYEIRSYKSQSDFNLSLKSRAENLIFFCVSIITIIYGKIDI